MLETQTFKTPKNVGAVAPFPKKRFMGFIKQLRVQTKDFGLQPLKLLGSQSYIIDEIEDGLSKGITTFVIVKARQLGSSSLLLAIDLFWAFEYGGLSGAFATHDDLSRELFRNMIEVFIAHLPATHKIDKRAHNRQMLVLKNGSQFAYLVAGTKHKAAGKSGLGRSGAYNFLHATEVAYWGNEDDLKEMRAAMSTHNPRRLQVYESTANGFNHFQEMCEKAAESSTQKLIFVGWWRNELYRFEKGTQAYNAYMPQGDATPYTVLERKRMRIVKELYSFEIEREQIAWYRWKLEDDADGDQMKMDEMFPFTLEDAFVATGSKFFTNESLTDAMRSARKAPFMPFKYVFGFQWSDTGVMPTKNQKLAELRIWEHPDPHGSYAIGCDPAYGSSETADRSVIEVFRCYADKCVQVAEFATSSVSTYQCAWALCHIAGYYKNVMVNLEITGPGQAVFAEMNALRAATARVNPKSAAQEDVETSRQIRACLVTIQNYLHKRIDAMGSELCYQFKTTAEIKLAIMNSFKDSFELQRCLIRSLPLLVEMKGIVYDQGSVGAEGRNKDDRVVASALAHHAWKRWLQPNLIARGLTYKRALERTTTPSQANTMVLDYLRKAKISLAGGVG